MAESLMIPRKNLEYCDRAYTRDLIYAIVEDHGDIRLHFELLKVMDEAYGCKETPIEQLACGYFKKLVRWAMSRKLFPARLDTPSVSMFVNQYQLRNVS